MKKITLSLIAITFFYIATTAQTGTQKGFNFLNQRNGRSSGLQFQVAEILKTSTTTIPEIQAGTPELQPSTKPKTLNPTDKPALKREVTKDYSIFVLTGASATAASTSIQAKFGYDGKSKDSINMELYKVEVKDGNRIFSVIAGKTLSVKIPIRFIPDIYDNVNNSEVNILTQIVIDNYLTQGEYIFIDKGSISKDGAQINCYAFKIL
jgi:hypothetical protein